MKQTGMQSKTIWSLYPFFSRFPDNRTVKQHLLLSSLRSHIRPPECLAASFGAWLPQPAKERSKKLIPLPKQPFYQQVPWLWPHAPICVRRILSCAPKRAYNIRIHRRPSGRGQTGKGAPRGGFSEGFHCLMRAFLKALFFGRRFPWENRNVVSAFGGEKRRALSYWSIGLGRI